MRARCRRRHRLRYRCRAAAGACATGSTATGAATCTARGAGVVARCAASAVAGWRPGRRPMGQPHRRYRGRRARRVAAVATGDRRCRVAAEQCCAAGRRLTTARRRVGRRAGGATATVSRRTAGCCATGSRTTGVAAGVSTATAVRRQRRFRRWGRQWRCRRCRCWSRRRRHLPWRASVTALGVSVATDCLARLGLAGVLLLDNGARVVLAGVGLAAVLRDLGIARRVAAGVAAIRGRAVARGAAGVRLTVGRAATSCGAVPALVARVSRALGVAALVLDGVLDVSAVAGGLATSGNSSADVAGTACQRSRCFDPPLRPGSRSA